MASLTEKIAQRHYQPLPASGWPLLPLEWGYGMGVTARLLAYKLKLLKPVKVPAPVISVGNLTTVGTGKTPVVLAIAEGLLKRGFRVVILSRGYGAEEPIDYGRVKHPKQGDEAYFLQQQLPDAVVIVGKNRASNAQQAYREFRPDFILLDDGFQYLRLYRDLNILLVDGQHGFGNGHLLPLGPVREPLDQLARANLIWVTKQPSPASLQVVQQRLGKAAIPVRPLEFEVTGLRNLKTNTLSPPSELQGLPVIALSGIAQPDAFENNLKELGITVRKHVRFPDHQVYQPQHIVPLLDAMEPEEVLVTTDKDLVKITPLIPPVHRHRVHSLAIQPALDFEVFFNELLAPLVPAPRPSIQPQDAASHVR